VENSINHRAHSSLKELAKRHTWSYTDETHHHGFPRPLTIWSPLVFQASVRPCPPAPILQLIPTSVFFELVPFPTLGSFFLVLGMFLLHFLHHVHLLVLGEDFLIHSIPPEECFASHPWTHLLSICCLTKCLLDCFAQIPLKSIVGTQLSCSLGHRDLCGYVRKNDLE
jgi:hypothetical protein